MPNEHHKGIFITGTDTSAGKTYIGVSLVKSLVTAGVDVQIRKPVESGCELRGDGLLPTDGKCYYEAIGKKTPLDVITPYRYMAALAPPQAAKLEGHSLSTKQLVTACTNNLSVESKSIVEGVGGFYSPIADDGLNADLAKQLNYPVLVVAANRLGCINHVLLTLNALENYGLKTMAVVLNQLCAEDASVTSNATSLKNLTDLPIISIEFNQGEIEKTSAQFNNLMRLVLAELSV